MKVKPWLWIPPQWSHHVAPLVVPALGHALRLCSDSKTPQWKSFNWKGLHFDNPLGVAGGVDKEGYQLLAWQSLGAGFVEVGTITPLPQGPNPGQIISRDNKLQALWNKMGFPNEGVDALKKNLEKIKPLLNVPLFINIGKNRDTKNEDALQDYLTCIRRLKNDTSVFVINISSPNTKGLRDLQSLDQLKKLIQPLRQETSQHQLLLKLSPDLSVDALKDILDLCLAEKMDGVILTNTTLQRPIQLPFNSQEGGVSGEPLRLIARQALIETVKHLGKDRDRLLLVSVGGITNFEEAQWRLDQGANLLQTYSGLVFEGPFFFRKAAKHPWH